jgi:hypothetical protein
MSKIIELSIQEKEDAIKINNVTLPADIIFHDGSKISQYKKCEEFPKMVNEDDIYNFILLNRNLLEEICIYPNLELHLCVKVLFKNNLNKPIYFIYFKLLLNTNLDDFVGKFKNKGFICSLNTEKQTARIFPIKIKVISE